MPSDKDRHSAMDGPAPSIKSASGTDTDDASETIPSRDTLSPLSKQHFLLLLLRARSLTLAPANNQSDRTSIPQRSRDSPYLLPRLPQHHNSLPHATSAPRPSSIMAMGEGSRPAAMPSKVPAPTKLCLDFDFDQTAAKKKHWVHKHAEKEGECFMRPDGPKYAYEPAENVPIFMWNINAKKLGFRQCFDEDLVVVSALQKDCDNGREQQTQKQSRKQTQKVLHAFMYM